MKSGKSGFRSSFGGWKEVLLVMQIIKKKLINKTISRNFPSTLCITLSKIVISIIMLHAHEISEDFGNSSKRLPRIINLPETIRKL